MSLRLGTRIADVLPQDELAKALPDGELEKLHQISDREQLRVFLDAHPQFAGLVHKNLADVKDAFKRDNPVHNTGMFALVVRGTGAIMPGSFRDPLLLPDAQLGARSIALPPDLDSQVSALYDDMNSRWLSLKPNRRFWRAVHKFQDKLNAVLGEHQDLLGDLMSFVDVFPRIKDDAAEVREHLSERFPGRDPRLGLIGFALDLVGRMSPERARKSLITGISLMADRFIAGATAKAASPRLRQLAKDGIGVIADIVGEAVKTEEEARYYIDTYKELIWDLAGDEVLIAAARRNWQKLEQSASVPLFDEEHRYDFQVAIKLSSLYSQWNTADPEGTAKVVKERFREVLDKVLETERKKKVKIGLTVDLEQFEYRDLTYKIFKEVLSEDKYRAMDRVGIVVQAYLKDSPKIIHDLAHWSHQRGKSVQIRLVKGAYWDYERMRNSHEGYPLPTFQTQQETDANFLDCMDLIFAYKKYLRASIGSHNAQAYLEAIAKARANDVPLELQMLLGMEDDRKVQIAKMGVPISTYVPIGELLPGMAYLARRFLENASQGGFLFKSTSKKVKKGDLLRNPRLGDRPRPNREFGIAPSSAGEMGEYRREPLRDFSDPANRAAIRKELRRMWWTHTDNIFMLPKADAEDDDQPEIPFDGVLAPEEIAPDDDMPELLVSPGLADLILPASTDGEEVADDGEEALIHASSAALQALRFEEPPAEYGLIWRNVPREDFAALVEDGFDLQSLFKPEEAKTTYDPEVWRQPLVSTNPANVNEVLGRIKPPQSPKTVALAALTAHEGFLKWSKTSVDHRVSLLRGVAQKMREFKDELTALIMKESGKSVREADADVAEAIDFIEYYAREAIKMYRDNPDRAIKALGVTAVISPWNFPLAILCGMTVAALVTGNSVVMKPSEETPLIAKKFHEMLLAAGLPEDAVQYLPGGAHVGKELLNSRYVKNVAFTGSKDAGISIYQQMIPRGVNVIAEMGGKNALIVDSDAHPDDVIQAVINGKFGYAGQKCSAIDRLIIVGTEAQYQEIKDRLIKALAALKVGDPEDFGNFNGPVIRQKDKDRVNELIHQVVLSELYAKIESHRMVISVEDKKELIKIARQLNPSTEVATLILRELEGIDVGTKMAAYGFKSETRARWLDILQAHGRNAKVKGRLLYDGRTHPNVPSIGHYVGPTLVETEDYEGSLWQNETFAPFLAITRARTIEEAVALAQKSQYALTGGYIGRSLTRKQYVLDNWKVGNLYINREKSGTTGAVVGENSFGGLGLSGINGSKAGGPQYLWQFVETEWLNQAVRPKKADWYKRLVDTFERIKNNHAIQDQKQQWHPLHSPLGIRNYTDFHSRGKGVIVAELQHLANVAELITMAKMSGNRFEVVIIDKDHYSASEGRAIAPAEPVEVVSINGQVITVGSPKAAIHEFNPDTNSFETFDYEAMPWTDVFEKLRSIDTRWVAFANPESAFPELKKAAVHVAEGQNFVRSIMTFRDPLGEVEKAASMFFEPRTVSDNLSRHGFVPPSDKGGNQGGPKRLIRPKAPQRRLMRGASSKRLGHEGTGSSMARTLTASAGLNMGLNQATPLGPVAGALAFVR